MSKQFTSTFFSSGFVSAARFTVFAAFSCFAPFTCSELSFTRGCGEVLAGGELAVDRLPAGRCVVFPLSLSSKAPPTDSWLSKSYSLSFCDSASESCLSTCLLLLNHRFVTIIYMNLMTYMC